LFFFTIIALFKCIGIFIGIFDNHNENRMHRW
jgi:hypothetical protein